MTTPSQKAAKNESHRRGFFLVLVLVVLAMATFAAYSFTDMMLAHDEAAYLSRDYAQAEMLVESGVEAVRLILAQPPAIRDGAGGVYSNPGLFQAASVIPGVEAFERGNFTIITSASDETGQMTGIRYGLQNESSRLNLNVLTILEESGGPLVAAMSLLGATGEEASDQEATTSDNLARSLLMGLPGMTVEVADGILDFLDEDDEPREYGAESEYYLALPSPYNAKNGPLDSVEELLLCRGVTPTMLFGADANRNGVLDAGEQSNALGVGMTTISLGWSAYLTVYSLENNKKADGTPRVNVNIDNMETLYADLSAVMGNDDWASFIVAYRIAGQAGGGIASSLMGATGAAPAAGEGQGGESSGEITLWNASILEKMDLSGGAGTRVNQLLDLVNARVEVDGVTYLSPFLDGPIAMAIYMPALMGNLATQDFQTMPGRININECPAELIRGIPFLSAESADAIIEARGQTNDSENRKFETWPLVEGLITIDQMRLLMPIVTSGGDIYRAQVVGYFEGKNASSRAEVVIDATSVNPKVIYWRNLSHLGRGFDVAVLGVRSQDAFQSMLQSATR